MKPLETFLDGQVALSSLFVSPRQDLKVGRVAKLAGARRQLDIRICLLRNSPSARTQKQRFETTLILPFVVLNARDASSAEDLTAPLNPAGHLQMAASPWKLATPAMPPVRLSGGVLLPRTSFLLLPASFLFHTQPDGPDDETSYEIDPVRLPRASPASIIWIENTIFDFRFSIYYACHPCAGSIR
eukprot:TRINITY_DN1122_c0_g1_i3.p1 TRINITY_DN1122_c0_g1~~TRINITY_DN1122_c0_g1_i3.p1  ORF type:complete len:186 (-),score=9.75 TRINITY_DN1122_c0_g1_i3:47-604(-)